MVDQSNRHEIADSEPAGRESRTPAARGQPVIVFDGVCNLCNGFVRFVLARDRHERFLFLPLQSLDADDEARSRFAAEGPPGTSILLLQDGEVFSKSSAVLRIVSAFGGIWSVARVALLTPKFVRDFAYDLVARNRYRVFGRRDECMIPGPEVRSRFLSSSEEIVGAVQASDIRSER